MSRFDMFAIGIDRPRSSSCQRRSHLCYCCHRGNSGTIAWLDVAVMQASIHAGQSAGLSIYLCATGMHAHSLPPSLARSPAGATHRQVLLTDWSVTKQTNAPRCAGTVPVVQVGTQAPGASIGCTAIWKIDGASGTDVFELACELKYFVTAQVSNFDLI